MIVQTKNGIMLHGEIAKDPVIRDAGQKRVLKFDLKASRTQDETGKWQSFFVGVNLWHGIDQWDGMLQKGDQVTVFAQKLKEREYNGKVYCDVDADDVQPGGLVTFRWLQQMIDLMAQPGPPLEPAEPAGLQGAQMYPCETLADYAPHSTVAPEPAPSTEYDPINEDAEDLPF
jgi:hypothetical protein